MCKINYSCNVEALLLSFGLNLIGTAMEASLREQPKAYQQGEITKSQLVAVIDALDKQTYQLRAYTVPNSSKLMGR